MKYLKRFENKENKHTKIVFYWTHAEHSNFGKTVFEWIVDEMFENKSDVQEFLDDNINYIYDKFDFSIVFDHVVMNFSDTNEPIHDVEIIDKEKGKLVFDKKKTETKVTKVDNTVSELIDKLSKEIDKLKSDLSDSELKRLKHSVTSLKLELELVKNKKEDSKPTEKKHIDHVGLNQMVLFITLDLLNIMSLPVSG